ncbi:MAG: hypothetical protein M9894_30820 [Planctomycetes bacterium]|nr:hypothetical protein [Planctomycetota bacterium]
MQRHNGDVLRLRPVLSAPASEAEGRSTCRTCGRAVPRGQDRPFCLEHAPYARTLRLALGHA